MLLIEVILLQGYSHYLIRTHISIQYNQTAYNGGILIRKSCLKISLQYDSEIWIKKKEKKKRNKIWHDFIKMMSNVELFNYVFS